MISVCKALWMGSVLSTLCPFFCKPGLGGVEDCPKTIVLIGTYVAVVQNISCSVISRVSYAAATAITFS